MNNTELVRGLAEGWYDAPNYADGPFLFYIKQNKIWAFLNNNPKMESFDFLKNPEDFVGDKEAPNGAEMRTYDHGSLSNLLKTGGGGWLPQQFSHFEKLVPINFIPHDWEDLLELT